MPLAAVDYTPVTFMARNFSRLCLNIPVFSTLIGQSNSAVLKAPKRQLLRLLAFVSDTLTMVDRVSDININTVLMVNKRKTLEKDYKLSSQACIN